MARPFKSEKLNTRQRILDTAEQMFASQGYYGTSLQQICESVGISRRSLLHYFESKAGLFEEIVRVRIVQGATDVVDRSLRSTKPPDEIFFDTLIQFASLLQTRSALVAVAFAQLMQPDGAARELVHDLTLPVLDRLETYLRQAFTPPIPPEAPVRTALMQLTVSVTGRVGMGKLGDDLWGDSSELLMLARATLIDLREWPRLPSK